ncbi:cytochrome, mitochondrial, partial [Armadillidium vulgare]
YFPNLGKYSFKRLHRNGLLKYKDFGPLVRENLFGDVNLLFVFDPEDIAQVLSNDGQYPSRRSHIALQKYRLDRPHMYSSGGLLPTNGDEWWRLRREAQKVITRIPCVRSHLPVVDEVLQFYR